MDTLSFWHLLGDICQLGEFIVAIEKSGVEINIVGKFRIIHDGIELVLEKESCGDHFHLFLEKIKVIHFGYCKNDIGVIELCLELIDLDDQVSLVLVYYPYQESDLKPKYRQFMEQHSSYKELITGEW